MVCAYLPLVSLVIIVYISVTYAETYNYDYTSYTKQYTRKINLKQGVLQGIVVEPRVNRALSPVEQYLGIPYAAPPVGDLRFMPPGSAPSWFGLKYADSLGAVCPQKLPNMNTMEASRKEYFNRLKKYLHNESEDCLYLNIYAPLQDALRPYSKKYPVMVFIHGESFEWNSGNPYDGSVLASYGKVIVVTLNFRLGILGFLKVGLEDTASSNFGLVDQVAALLWIQENIAAFGGDPNSITLFGHGTGAACISMLMLSPMVAREGKPLFHRAILMSGTALSDWAMASTSQQVTYQVAEALNCPTDEKLATCLRKKRINEIMEVAASTREYTTRFGPIVDGLVIPNDPNKIMSSYNDFFRRFELMYGLTEVESVHLLEPVAFTYGLLEKERDQELRKYLYARYEHKPEYYVAHTLALYTGGVDGVTDQLQGGYTGHEPDRASVARDMLLDMLSDARSAAPVALMARYHAAVNPQSYFYVFGHTTSSREFLRNKTAHGEELPYVFGVPLDGPKFHFEDHYNNQERLFSEAVMALWTNFAYSGDPNIRRRNEYLTLFPKDWRQYDIEWPEFDRRSEQYLYLAIPPEVRDHYRSREIHYWNEALPNLLNNHSNIHLIINRPPPRHPPQYSNLPRAPPRNLPPWFQKGTSPDKHVNKADNKKEVFGTIKLTPDENSVNSKSMKKEYGTVITAQTQQKASGTAMIILIIVGGIFLLVNVVLFVALYYKCTKIKSRESSQKRSYEDPIEVRGSISGKRVQGAADDDDNGCSIMKMISKSSKSEDTYEAVKISEDGSSKYKLRRDISASTIDPHTKVRDWIAHEIVQRCSPKFLRPEEAPSSTHVRTDSKTTESYSTLGRSPTRPVSPVEGEMISRLSGIPKPKPQKVSVAIDATPAARSPSVLRQQPIELTKSLDYSYRASEAPIRRSNTVDNFLDAKLPNELRRSTTNIDLKSSATIVKIEHHHAKSKSEPVQNFDRSPYATLGRKMKTFDPTSVADINVTSREEDDDITPLTPEESLMTIKRRNYPKVLPDYPDKQYLIQKRRSMPVPNQLFLPIPENAVHSQPNSPTNKMPSKFPPAPPPRSSSSLGRKPVNTSPFAQSSAMVAEEPPVPQEPEIACNNLYVGPLIPSRENRKIDMKPLQRQTSTDSQPLYDNIVSVKEEAEKKIEKVPKTIITTDPNNPIKKLDAKVIIKPTITRNTIDRNRQIPRVTAKDNIDNEEETDRNKTIPRVTIKDNPVDSPSQGNAEENIKTKASQIPKLVKTSNPNLNKEGSSESSPSDESETGTVIKRV